MIIDELEKNYNKFIYVLEKKMFNSKKEILEIINLMENNALEILFNPEC